MNWFSYYQHIRHSKRDRSTMASVLLIRMAPEHPTQLDVSKLRLLSEANRLWTFAFLDWHLANPMSRLRPEFSDLLRQIVANPRVMPSGPDLYETP